MTKLVKVIKNNCSVVCFLVLVLVLIVTTTFGKVKRKDIKEILAPGQFGNLRIAVAKELSTDKETLLILNNKEPLMVIEKDKSGEISSCTFTNKSGRRLAIADLEKGRISGIRITNLETEASFSVDISPKSGNLVKAQYYPPFGNGYRDINFDGQFDVKVLFPKDDGKKAIPYIFLDGEWHRMAWVDSNTNEAGVLSFGQKVFYDFEFGKGWKKRDSGK